MRKGQKQTASAKRKIAKSMTGTSNPAYKNGGRSYRRIANAKKGDLVHHRDGNRKNNTKSNLRVIPKSQRSKHDKMHHRERNFKK